MNLKMSFPSVYKWHFCMFICILVCYFHIISSVVFFLIYFFFFLNLPKMKNCLGNGTWSTDKSCAPYISVCSSDPCCLLCKTIIMNFLPLKVCTDGVLSKTMVQEMWIGFQFFMKIWFRAIRDWKFKWKTQQQWNFRGDYILKIRESSYFLFHWTGHCLPEQKLGEAIQYQFPSQRS